METKEEELPHTWIELSEAIQRQIMQGILELVKNDRKRRSLWQRLVRFFNRINISKCFCGTGGVGCECEIKPPPPILPERVRVRKMLSGSRVEAPHESEAIVASTMI